MPRAQDGSARPTNGKFGHARTPGSEGLYDVAPPRQGIPDAGAKAEPPDEALARMSLSGDLAAFEKLARRFQGRLFTFALRMTGDVQEAEDLTQETLLRAFQSLRRFDPALSFAAWVFGIAAHVCRDWLRGQGRRREAPSEAVERAHTTATPGDAAGASEERERVLWAVRRLPRKYREVIVLHYLEEMGYDEVAASLGIRPEAARRRALRAREMLRGYLDEGASR